MESNLPSTNLCRVFIDTEFTNFMNPDLISIGAVCDNGQTFYGENLDFLKPLSSDWVKENIYPLLRGGEYSMKRIVLAARFWEWISDLPFDSVIITYDYHTDIDLLFQLFDEQVHPKVVSSELINSIIYLFCDRTVPLGDVTAYQEKVEKMVTLFHDTVEQFYPKTGKVRHDALNDAEANATAFKAMCEQFNLVSNQIQVNANV